MWEEPPPLVEFRRGDHEALTVVYRRFVDDVLRLLRLGFYTQGPPPARVPGLRDDSDQMDAAQEVFVRAFREPARIAYDGLRPYRPYLLRIARNLRIDQCRSSGRELLSGEGVLDVDSLLERGGPVPEPSPEHNAEWTQLSERTQHYLQSQDAETQRYVQLRFVEELSQAEVAAQMQISRRRVRTLEARVLRGLRRHLSRPVQT